MVRKNDDPEGPRPFAPLPYRLRIGVTGHRKLPSKDNFESLVLEAVESTLWECFEPESRQVLRTAKENGSPPVLLEVLSALAEGADRLVANVLHEKGSVLRAVLPLTDSDYRATFADDASREEFEHCLRKSHRPVRLRTRDLAQDDPDPGRQAELRKDAFEDAGCYIVDHCHVLLALWDGEDSDKQGGTFDIVAYALGEGRPVIRVWDGVPKRLNPEVQISAQVEGMRKFNAARLSKEAYESRVERFRLTFFGADPAACPLGKADRDMLEGWLVPYYSLASHLAGRNQSQFFRLGGLVYTLSALAMGCVAMAVLWHSVKWFGAELVMLLLIVGALQWSRRVSPSAAWMECRVLAERLRCTAFLAMCGLEPAPLEVLPFMANAHGPDDWMVHAFEGILDRQPRLTGLPPAFDLKQHFKRYWIQMQADFHENTASREHARHRRMEWGGGIALAATMLAAVLHIGWEHMPNPLLSNSWINDGFTMVAILCPAIAAALVGVQVQREHHRLSVRSATLAKQMERLGRRLERTVTSKRMNDVLVATDEVMLRESQDWLMLMRHVEIKTG